MINNEMIFITEFIMLTLMEIVLNIDNIIFISIVVDKVPKKQQFIVKSMGLSLALIFRIFALMGVEKLSHLESKIFFSFSIKDLLYFSGGMFLLYSSIKEMIVIHKQSSEVQNIAQPTSIFHAMFKILIVDIIFSVDSVITLVGIVETLQMMYMIVGASILIIMILLSTLNNTLTKHQWLKYIFLFFIGAVGLSLMLESFDIIIDKSYIYSSIIIPSIIIIYNKLRKKLSL